MLIKNCRQFFEGNNRVTPLVTAPADTNPNDATAFSVVVVVVVVVM